MVTINTSINSRGDILENFQRIGSISNAHVGKDFEDIAQRIFEEQGYNVEKNVGIEIGIQNKKIRRFDLGTTVVGEEKIIIECKSHRWTRPNDNTPSAKLTNWNEAMYYFHLAPEDYRKILFILRDYSVRRNETLGEYYIRVYNHLIPHNVEIWEYDEEIQFVQRIY